MGHDRTNDAEILPFLLTNDLPTTNAPSWYPEIAELLICDWFCIDNMGYCKAATSRSKDLCTLIASFAAAINSIHS